jgi:hypothetical protein
MPDDPTLNNGQDPAGDTTPPGTEPDSQNADGGGNTDINDWKAKQSVPYSRFEEVIRANQEYRDTLTQRLDEVMEQINSFKSQPAPSNQGSDQETPWNQRAKSAKSWDEFVSAIQDDTFQRWEQRQKEKEAEAEKALDMEIKSLYSRGIVKSKDEENAILDFAVKKSQELKYNVPLAVAAAWMKETAKVPNNLDAAAKAKSSLKSQGGPGKGNPAYKDIRGKDLDEIIMEAKENAPKAE